ncbi:MAG: penicillin-insensitive murein endopeptidase [bacterium]
MRKLTLALTLLASSPALADEEPAVHHPLVQSAIDGFKAWRERRDPLALVVWHPAAVVGPPGKGRLLFGVQMQPSPGIHIRNPNEAWTVPEVVRALREAHAIVEKAHPGSPDMVVGDLSMRHGGRFPPHRTHQNGTDVDLRYYLLGEQPADYAYRFVTPQNFDTARVWTLIQHLYTTGQAERILVDTRHQKRLYAYARKQLDLSPEQLEPILSYPKAAARPDALVRHARGHHNHIHIRFKAPIATLVGQLWERDEAIDAQRAFDLAILGEYDYVVRRGDTLSAIAARNEVSVEELVAWNGLGKRAVLRPGKVIKVMRTN